MSATNYQVKPNIIAPKIIGELYNKAIDIFNIPSTMYDELSIGLHICKELDKLNISYSIDNFGNIIAVKGKKLYSCFCCHLDTVHIYKNGFTLMHSKEGERDYFWARDKDKKRIGVGGDDKNGIFVCLYLLERIDNIKVIFFSQEESGGIGSSNIDINIFSDCKFLGSVDRWNGHDFINKYSGDFTISNDLKKAILPILNKYDYSFNSGLFTDSFNVMERDVNISCFNVSCGYYSHHSDSEYIDLNELYNCCLLCVELANLPKQYKHKIKKANKLSAWNWNSDDIRNKRVYNGYDIKRDDHYIEGLRYCECCGLELFDWETGKHCTSCKSYFRDDIDVDAFMNDNDD